jgi:hypothetical protein
MTDLCPGRIFLAQFQRNFPGHLYKTLSYVKKMSLNKLRVNQSVIYVVELKLVALQTCQILRIEGVAWSAQRIPTAVSSVF